MANQARPRGSRGTALGVLSGRLRGGFMASSLPRASSIAAVEVPRNSPSPSTPHVSLGGDHSDRNQGGSGSQEITPSCDLVSIVTTLRGMHETVKKLDHKIVSVEQQQMKLTESVNELCALLKKQERNSFSMKGSTWEVPLKEQAAKLFCLSLTRDPSDTDIHEAVAKVVGRVGMKERHKVQLALKFLKAKLTDYRSEERRKVLGHAPYKASCYMSTRELGIQIMWQMHTPDDVDEEIYIRHLAIFRKFVRLSDDDKSATYQVFQKWLDQTSINDETWSEIVDEDEAFDY